MLLNMLREVMSVKHSRFNVPGYQKTCSLGITRFFVLFVLATFKTLGPILHFPPCGEYVAIGLLGQRSNT